MRISISNAADRLSELVRLAQQGEDVVLTTEDGTDAVRLEASSTQTDERRHPDPEERRRALDQLLLRVQDDAVRIQPSGSDAARSQDFLYDDETGLPA